MSEITFIKEEKLQPYEDFKFVLRRNLQGKMIAGPVTHNGSTLVSTHTLHQRLTA
jgi:hypothetical protein